MAGVQGKSGGPRPNSGGARTGAGRKAKALAEKSANKSANGDRAKSANEDDGKASSVETRLEPQPRGGALKRSKAVPVEIESCDMLTLLQRIALGQVDASAGQIRAAVAAVQYTHIKKGDGGKKDDDAEKAKKAGAGRFAAAPPPKLVAAGGKKV